VNRGASDGGGYSKGDQDCNTGYSVSHAEAGVYESSDQPYEEQVSKVKHRERLLELFYKKVRGNSIA